MKTKILPFLLMVGFLLPDLICRAQAPDFLWAKNAGGASYDYANSVVATEAGNSIVTGSYNTGITFGPSWTFVSAGSSDVYLVEYDAAGNALWAKSIGGTDDDRCMSVKRDQEGNIFISGYFKSNVLDIGDTTLNNAGGNTYDMFVAKFDSDGNFSWAQKFGNTGDDRSYSIATDPFGNCFITGYFVSSTINFGTFTLTNSGNVDVFAAKISSNGTVLWAKSATGSGADYSVSIAADHHGNCFLTGYYNSNPITFESVPLPNVNASFKDIFIVKYTSDGNLGWVRRAGGNTDDKPTAIAVDTAGNVFLTGGFKSPSLIFDDFTLTNPSTSSEDVFVVKLDAIGTALWAKSAGGTAIDMAYAIAVDEPGNCYISGSFVSTGITFGLTTLNNAGTSTADMFITEYSKDGLELWAKSAGGSSEDIAYANAVDASGNSFLAGYFSSPTLDFGITTLMLAGTTDMFITKLDGYSGISEMSDHSNFSVYPNPAGDDVIISVPSQGTIQLLNCSGQLVKSFMAEQQLVLFSVTDFKAGLYFVRFISNDHSFVKMLVKE